MRMLVKYTSFNDYDKDFKEVDRSWYLSFVKRDDVIDIPFESKDELAKKANEYTLADFVKSEEFKNELESFEDAREFFGDIDTLVLYGKDIKVNFKDFFEESSEDTNN